MKLIEIPQNTLVELQFFYMGERHKVGVGLLYKNEKAVYVSAIKNAGKTVPATHLYNTVLTYKTSEGLYIFKSITLRSISYNGQKLYVIQTDQEAMIVDYRKSYRLYLGKNISAKIIMDDQSKNIHCILRDISMSGMWLLTNIQIDPSAKIEIGFRVNKKDKEKLVGSITQVEEFKNNTGFLYTCEFQEPNEIIGKFVEYHIERMNKKNQEQVNEA